MIMMPEEVEMIKNLFFIIKLELCISFELFWLIL